MGIMAGIRTGTGGISLPICTYQQLSTEFNNDIEQVTQSIEALQNQVDSLVSIVLQKGGMCLFLNEEGCFYANKLGWSESWPNS
jgi:hypothetical protein